ncbi:RdgB/HAM1 family non-canonical purine NTP pyrophosphatase [Actinomadura sp. BRA 177]|uniref:RdgB/HAM1 family non-canonical purine NTP pyrophosphatase n=1 Tax=Actinomadura sp. BRA 177 TaxID=2745202 RepID=UPI0015958686|nr:RdgB/HAM1 family non-canonical purine NTP pyrophosphatase [Actinomadura sp. BRA 177]NVI92892.1 RdgB/HAM1 family non-canonical purine NTP pyrophosphatase [Actinomadura sp. BRA 177]
MTRIVLATHNQGKVAELHRILGDLDVAGLDEFPGAPDVAETELTFAGNAFLKARAIAAFTGLPAVADDSGLCVDALNGMPGVLSARWSGRFGAATGDRDAANLQLLLDQISDVADDLRGGAFVCAAVLATPDGVERSVEGRMHGMVIREPRGTGGFGYDPIFVPDGETRTTAEMSAAEKDAISHRGKAFRELAALVPDALAAGRS